MPLKNLQSALLAVLVNMRHLLKLKLVKIVRGVNIQNLELLVAIHVLKGLIPVLLPISPAFLVVPDRGQQPKLPHARRALLGSIVLLVLDVLTVKQEDIKQR